jgi:hypothetical protein
MARLNTANSPPRTHEGALARAISAELELRRSVLACLLWESQFYEDGVEIAAASRSWCRRSSLREWRRSRSRLASR